MISNLVLLGVCAASFLLLVACVLGVKAWKKRDDRRSPLQGRKLANLPGQQLMERMNEHGEEVLLSAMLMYFTLPLMLSAWALGRVEWNGFRFGWREGVFLIAAAIVFFGAFRRFVKHMDARNRAKDGLIAEQLTGQLLNRLIGPDCIVAHDLPCDGFNIDHVVIAPRAVYAVETKSFRKKRGSADDSHYKVSFDGEALRFSGWTDSGPVQQARSQAQWLARYLRDALGRDIPVVPAVALPGWWIERTEAGKRSDVRVFTPVGRGAEFLLSGQEVLEAPMRSLVAQAVGLRYPEISDR